MNNTCMVCDSRNIRTFIRKEDLPNQRAVLKCSECGLIFFQDGRAVLDNTYWDKDKQKKMYEETQVRKGFEQEFRDRLRAISGIIEKGRLLDIGCGMGEFLNVAKILGWEAYGVEISKKAADFVTQGYGFDVFRGTVENCNFKDEFFNTVTLWDVIEHIQFPRETLKAINRKLKKNGLLVIKTPDENGVFKRAARFLYWISAKRVKFLLKYVYYLPHYFSYSPRTLRQLLKNHGFRIIKVEKDKTNLDFARTKIQHHYAKFKSRVFVLFLLPIVYFLMNLFGLHNKMVIYARKEC